MTKSILTAMGNLALKAYLERLELEQVQMLKAARIPEAEVLELAIRDAGHEVVSRIMKGEFTFRN